MGFSRGPDGKIEITNCKGFCQMQGSTQTCGNGCRNKINDININQDKNIIDENIVEENIIDENIVDENIIDENISYLKSKLEDITYKLNNAVNEQYIKFLIEKRTRIITTYTRILFNNKNCKNRNKKYIPYKEKHINILV